MKAKEKFLIVLITLLFVAGFFSENCIAILVPYIRIGKLIETSDLICKGRVIRTDKIGQSERRNEEGQLIAKIDSKVAVFQVDRVIKGGPIIDPLEVEFEDVSQGVYLGYEPLDPNEYVILFLKKKGSKYAFTSQYRGKIHISREPLKVEAKGSDPMALIKQELLNSLKDKDPNATLPSLKILEELKDKSAEVHIDALLDRLDPNAVAVRGQALITLIRIGNIDHIAEAINYIDQETTTRTHKFYKTFLTHSLERIRDPNAIVQLHPLLKHPNELVRSQVAQSLRHIKSPSSIPYLIEGLDDSNVNVRYSCMMGLYKMLGKKGNWGATTNYFRANESEYLSLWKNWWQQEGKEKYGLK